MKLNEFIYRVLVLLILVTGTFFFFLQVISGRELHSAITELSFARAKVKMLVYENDRLNNIEPVDDRELLVTALTLFGSGKRPGEAYLDNDTAAQLAVLDSARNRAKVCGTPMRDEFLKWGYSKKENKYKAMYSVWEDGGPKIGFSDIKRFSKALTQARKVILLSRTTSPDKRITHYHQTGMKSPPAWSNVFVPIKKIGGNSFYQEVSESGSYCNAFVPKSIPIPVKIKPRDRKSVV